MLKKGEFWILTTAALLLLALILVNMSLFLSNRSAQAEVNTRSQYVQQSLQLEGLYREMVKALADLSARNQDTQLKDLLAKQGITFTVNPPAAAGSTTPAAGKSEPQQPVSGAVTSKDNKP